MGEKREIICIGCPMGCELTVKIEDKEVIEVTGNFCKRGEIYAEKECTNPTRIVTTTVYVDGGSIDVVPIKTEDDVPQNKVFEIITALKEIVVKAPVKTRDIIVENVANTGVNIIATRDVPAK
ncbi:DUF1667 domain-containing protein [Maledivibacter halophilus]|uniref:CxxC motif-containing protein n=1 Tax=Maledivibacter halophilus TaxID=36842 RepID=A0A1T5MNW8_9FIRM|nr:DUF1667 domain-containing protein [Maledivibacter halophilus]SKC89714.1 CxxC motif-containing protein [Maledivibacter halophilus]